MKFKLSIISLLAIFILATALVQASVLSLFYFESDSSASSLTITEGDSVNLILSGDGLVETSILMELLVDDSVVWSHTVAEDDYTKTSYLLPTYFESYTLTGTSVGTHTIKFRVTGATSGQVDEKTLTLVVEAAPVPGCTDPNADNYNPAATQDDGSCTYDSGDDNGGNDPNPSQDSTSPIVMITSPTDGTTYSAHQTSISYTSTDETGVVSCQYSLDGGTTRIDTTCGTLITGITSVEGSNTWIVYAKDAANNEGSASITFTVNTSVDPIYGCTDSDATNYDASATQDNGSCTYSSSSTSSPKTHKLVGEPTVFIPKNTNKITPQNKIIYLSSPVKKSTGIIWTILTPFRILAEWILQFISWIISLF